MKLNLAPLLLLSLGFASALPTSAQTPAGLGLQTYAGLTITGQVGAVYAIDCVADLAQTNNPAAWQRLEFLQLPATPYLWADKSGPLHAKRFYRAVAIPSPINMVFIPPGSFRMGSPAQEVDRFSQEGPQTAVTISRGFWMGQYEVTQGEFLALMGYNISYCSGDTNRPVEHVSWTEATNYCAKLTQREIAAGRIATNCAYRLPTEAEWEYACRAWTSTRFSYGDDPGYTNLTAYAWYFANSGPTTHRVGQKLPNPWGLYDMHGNVWEWCQDWWADALPGGLVLDPQGPATSFGRVVRGGCWSDWQSLPGQLRSADRRPVDPNAAGNDLGFRVVLAPVPPAP